MTTNWVNITPEAESSSTGIMRFRITASKTLSSARVSITSVGGFGIHHLDYTINFEKPSGEIFPWNDGYINSVFIQRDITLEDLQEYDIVVRRPASITEDKYVIVTLNAYMSGVTVGLNAVSGVLFTAPLSESGPLQITPDVESSVTRIMRFRIAAIMGSLPTIDISVTVSNTDDYTVSFENDSEEGFSGFSIVNGNINIAGATPVVLQDYSIVVRRITAMSEDEEFDIAIDTTLEDGPANAESTVLFMTPMISLETLPPPTTTESYFLITPVGMVDSSSATVQVDPPEFIISVVNQGVNYPGTSPRAGILHIPNVSPNGIFDGYRLVITRPPGVTSGAVVTVTMEISSFEATTTAQVEFADIPPPSTTDLQRGNTSTAGILLLTSAAVLCAVSMTQKLNRGIFFISLMTAFTGIVFLV